MLSFVLFDRISLGSPSQPRNHHVAQAGLELVAILFHQLPECWVQTTILGFFLSDKTEPKAFCMLGKCSIADLLLSREWMGVFGLALYHPPLFSKGEDERNTALHWQLGTWAFDLNAARFLNH